MWYWRNKTHALKAFVYMDICKHIFNAFFFLKHMWIGAALWFSTFPPDTTSDGSHSHFEKKSLNYREYLLSLSLFLL